jgi:hypothetical protein
MDFLHRSLRDQPSLDLVMITVDFGSARFASIRALVKAAKGTCTNIPVDANLEPDPSRNEVQARSGANSGAGSAGLAERVYGVCGGPD